MFDLAEIAALCR